jgi:glycosyltransferase involved in cell wall biosynthesis
MKICVLATSYPRSKNDYWVPFMHSWCKELAKTEDVSVVTSGGPGTKNYEVRDKVKISRFNYFYPKKLQKLTYTGGMKESFKHGFLPKIQAPFFLLFFLIKSLKIAKNCDVINAHWTLSGLAALPVKLIYKKPIVLTEHGGSIRGLPRFLNKFVIKRMDMITSAHSDMIKTIKDMGTDNVADIKNFLNEEKFLGKHNVKSIKKNLKIKNEFVVTFIGRFEDLKDPLTFVRAIPYITKKMKNIKFIMVGDGHLREDVENEIKKLGIGKYVYNPGPTFNVDKFLAVSDVFVACSAVENCFSTTILEAMLSKVPCIITKAGLTEKFFVHGKDAYLVRKKNPEELENAIIKMLKAKNLRNKLSKNGLKFLERYGFRNRIIKDKILGILNSAVKNKQ